MFDIATATTTITETTLNSRYMLVLATTLQRESEALIRGRNYYGPLALVQDAVMGLQGLLAVDWPQHPQHWMALDDYQELVKRLERTEDFIQAALTRDLEDTNG